MDSTAGATFGAATTIADVMNLLIQWSDSSIYPVSEHSILCWLKFYVVLSN